MKITYTTEDPSRKYAIGIRKAKNKEELLQFLNEYKEFTEEAILIVKKMTDDDFIQFQADLKKANRKNVEEKWIEYFNEAWGDIAIPRKLMISSLIAMQSFAPWGCAFIRCNDLKWKI